MNRKKSSFRVIVIFALLILCGISLVSKLDLKLNPEARASSLTISFSWQNAEPRVIEQKATSVIEAIAARVQGIRQISSRSGHGVGRITVTLDKKADSDAIRFELSTLIRQAWGSLPAEVSYPVITVNRFWQQQKASAGSKYMEPHLKNGSWYMILRKWNQQE